MNTSHAIITQGPLRQKNAFTNAQRILINHVVEEPMVCMRTGRLAWNYVNSGIGLTVSVHVYMHRYGCGMGNQIHLSLSLSIPISIYLSQGSYTLRIT